MKVVVERIAKLSTYTIGKLYIDGKYFCDTLEDADRGLRLDMSIELIKANKVYSKTAIPIGIYSVTLDVISEKFKLRGWALFCQGKLPRLIDVKGYEGVLIHVGNKSDDTSGCILVGLNKVKGQVIESTLTFKRLYEVLLTDKNNITIEIK